MINVSKKPTGARITQAILKFLHLASNLSSFWSYFVSYILATGYYYFISEAHAMDQEILSVRLRPFIGDAWITVYYQ